jgi:hypothetical protein
MKTVVTQLEHDVVQNQQKSRHADCQAEDVDKRIRFVLEQISGGDFEVVFEHE